MKKKIKNSRLAEVGNVNGGAVVVIVNGDNNNVIINGVGIDDDTKASNDGTDNDVNNDTENSTNESTSDDTENNTNESISNETGIGTFAKTDEQKGDAENLRKRLEKALSEKESLEMNLAMLKKEKEEQEKELNLLRNPVSNKESMKIQTPSISVEEKKREFAWDGIWDTLEGAVYIIIIVLGIAALVWLIGLGNKNISEPDEVWETYEEETNEFEDVDEEDEIEKCG